MEGSSSSIKIDMDDPNVVVVVPLDAVNVMQHDQLQGQQQNQHQVASSDPVNGASTTAAALPPEQQQPEVMPSLESIAPNGEDAAESDSEDNNDEPAIKPKSRKTKRKRSNEEKGEDGLPVGVPNPWACENVDEFQFYCCPQCDHKCKSKALFLNHAFVNHPLSQEGITVEVAEHLTRNISIKQELELEENMAYMGNVKTELKVEPSDFFDDFEDDWPEFNKRTKGKKRIKTESILDAPKKKKRKRGPPRPKIIENLDDGVEYQCYKCGEMLVSLRSVMEHQKAQHGKFTKRQYGTEIRTHQCPQCKALFKKESTMMLHFCDIQVDHKWGEQSECKICSQKFTRVEGLKKHISLVHNQERNFACDQCDYKGKSMRFIRDHKLRVHDKAKAHVCHICGNGFVSIYSLKAHISIKHNPEGVEPVEKASYVCDKCGKAYNSYHSFKSHVNYKHPVFYMCTLCEHIFTATSKLRLHLAEEHKIRLEKAEDIYVCKECQRQCTTIGELNEHMIGDHDCDALEFTCQICENVHFSTKMIMKLHMFQVHNFDPTSGSNASDNLFDIVVDEKIKLTSPHKDVIPTVHGQLLKGVKCDVCGRIMSCSRSLNDHKRQVHDKANHIKCDMCEFTTFQPYMLKRHKKDKHDKSVQYPCAKCNYIAYRRGALNAHIKKVHELIKPHPCTECDRSFATVTRKTSHMLKAHNVIFKYK